MNYRKLSAFLLTFIIYTILVLIAYKIIENMHLSKVYNEQKIKVNLRKKIPVKPKPIKQIDKKILKKEVEKAKFPKDDKKSPISKLPKPPNEQPMPKEAKPAIKKIQKKSVPSTFLEKKRAPNVSKSSPKKSIPKKTVIKKERPNKNNIKLSELKKFFKSEHNNTIKQKEKSPLYNSILALPVQKEKKKKEKPKNLIGQPIEKLYGDDFNKMSPYQRDYILNNAAIMQQITQKVLNRIGRINIPAQMHFKSINVVEFKLYPSGDISDITMLESAGFKILDQTTRETIEYAYKDYPHPEETITIRFLVGYYLMGF